MTSKLRALVGHAFGLAFWTLPFSLISVALGALAIWLGEPAGTITLKLGLDCLVFELGSLVGLFVAGQILFAWERGRGRV